MLFRSLCTVTLDGTRTNQAQKRVPGPPFRTPSLQQGLPYTKRNGLVSELSSGQNTCPPLSQRVRRTPLLSCRRINYKTLTTSRERRFRHITEGQHQHPTQQNKKKNLSPNLAINLHFSPLAMVPFMPPTRSSTSKMSTKKQMPMTPLPIGHPFPAAASAASFIPSDQPFF